MVKLGVCCYDSGSNYLNGLWEFVSTISFIKLWTEPNSKLAKAAVLFCKMLLWKASMVDHFPRRVVANKSDDNVRLETPREKFYLEKDFISDGHLLTPGILGK